MLKEVGWETKGQSQMRGGKSPNYRIDIGITLH
jgi:hypothetical protein